MLYEKPVLTDDNNLETTAVGAIAANIFWMANVFFTANGFVTANAVTEYNVVASTK